MDNCILCHLGWNCIQRLVLTLDSLICLVSRVRFFSFLIVNDSNWNGPEGNMIVLGNGGALFCFIKKKIIIAALWLELAFDFFSFFIRINCT